MKGLFPDYDLSEKLDYDAIWKNGLFVFDSSALLNLYRYQPGTRDELLTILKALSKRIWIPHHVALEFQRNRLTVLTEQGGGFDVAVDAIKSARKALNKCLEDANLIKRHSVIDSQDLLASFDAFTKDRIAILEAQKKAQRSLDSVDELRTKIEEIFNGRVGDQPTSQADIDALNAEAALRYSLRIPPGYEDIKKPDGYLHGGIAYECRYGDYIIWRQLLQHAKASKQTNIIFVTDDAKTDWWLKINLEGPKIIGPLPELVGEARSIAGINRFLMYSTKSFLEHAKEFLKASISEYALEDVHDVSRQGSPSEGGSPTLTPRELAVMNLVVAGMLNRQIATKLSLSKILCN